MVQYFTAPPTGRSEKYRKNGRGLRRELALLLPFFEDRMRESGVHWSIETRLEGGSCWSPALIPPSSSSSPWQLVSRTAVRKNVKRSSPDNKGGFRDHFSSRPWLERARCLGSDYGLLLPRGSRVLRLISGQVLSITYQNEGVNLLTSSRAGIEIHESCGVAGGRQFIAALSELEVHSPP